MGSILDEVAIGLQMSPAAATISVRETLDLLDGAFHAVGEGVTQARYALWLGSGISRERMPDLKGVIKRVLSYLRDRIEPGKTNCRFRKSLQEALKLAELTPAEQAGAPLDKPVEDWPSLPAILQRLTGKYSLLLDVPVAGEVSDFLLWDVVDVANTFSGILPDCEHFCVAILAIEGVTPDIVSANWDGLVEAAVGELNGPANTMLQVCVRDVDLRDAALRARLTKFHGCAIRAAKDPTIYRPLLVGRQSQITSWPDDPVWAAIRNELVNLAVTKPTLMVGLSAQDSNIQSIFSKAQATMRWPWPSNPPAYIFAEDELGNFQKNILRFVYRDAYDGNSVAIEKEADLPAFGKPLLTALVLYVLCSKLQAYARLADAPGLNSADHNLIALGIKALRDRVAGAAPTIPPLDFVKLLVHSNSRVLALFQEGQAPSAGTIAYRALGAQPVHQIPADPALPTSGVREMAVALGVLSAGESSGHWNLGNGEIGGTNDGAIRITPRSGKLTRVFFTSNSSAALRLETNGFVAADDDDALVIHSTSRVAPLPRHPRRAPGRTGMRQPRHVDMGKLLQQATGITELQQNFRIEAVL